MFNKVLKGERKKWPPKRQELLKRLGKIDSDEWSHLPEITEEIITELNNLAREHEKCAHIASEKLRTVKDQFGKRAVTVTREGKEVQATENDLWTEVFYLGEKGEATDILKKKYPDVFEAYAKQSAAAEAMNIFVIKNLGFDVKQMRLSDNIRLTRALVRLELKNLFNEYEEDGDETEEVASA